MRPKLPSFIDNFNELDCTFAFITETWFTENSSLEIEAENLLLGHGLKLFTLSRPAGNAGFSHGGVAIVAKDSATKLSVMNLPNPEKFEILTVFGTLAGVSRKVYFICVYIPPNYTVPRGKCCLSYLSDVVLHIKRKCNDALICIGGDFNQWDVVSALEDYPEIIEIITPATRKDRRIDKVLLNWPGMVVDADCFSPLEAENAAGERISTSDHNVQFVATALQRREPVSWESYTYRPFNIKSADSFTEELAKQDWTDVYQAEGSNKKAQLFQATLDDLMDRFFPMKTVKRKSTDLPWINDVARKKIRRKKAVFKYENRSPRWKALRDDLDEYLKKRQEKFLEKQRDKMMGPDSMRHFYKNVNNYKSCDKPKSFNVRDLRPGKGMERSPMKWRPTLIKSVQSLSPSNRTKFHLHITEIYRCFQSNR